jgi:hypothetical protein
VTDEIHFLWDRFSQYTVTSKQSEIAAILRIANFGVTFDSACQQTTLDVEIGAV